MCPRSRAGRCAEAENCERRRQSRGTCGRACRINTRENARLTFNQVLEEQLQKTLDSNFRFYNRVADDERFATFFIDMLFERFVKAVEEGEG
ncbi:MAG: hypothetical protein ACOC8B_00385 [Gemmatimonadota bacterium]